jgi:hypothetical protein
VSRVTKKGQEIIVAQYFKGDSIRFLADKYGYSYSGMHHLLESNGAVFRKQGGHPYRKGNLIKR